MSAILYRIPGLHRLQAAMQRRIRPNAPGTKKLKLSDHQQHLQ